jgi:hypothetical protein
LEFCLREDVIMVTTLDGFPKKPFARSGDDYYRTMGEATPTTGETVPGPLYAGPGTVSP